MELNAHRMHLSYESDLHLDFLDTVLKPAQEKEWILPPELHFRTHKHHFLIPINLESTYQPIQLIL